MDLEKYRKINKNKLEDLIDGTNIEEAAEEPDSDEDIRTKRLDDI